MTVGGVESYLRLKLDGALVFPATSVHVPLTEALPLSGPLKVVDVHEAIPEVAIAPGERHGDRGAVPAVAVRGTVGRAARDRGRVLVDFELEVERTLEVPSVAEQSSESVLVCGRS